MRSNAKASAPKPKYPNRRRPFFTLLKGFLRLIKPKTEVIDMTEGQGEPGIFLCNHSATTGPLMEELYLPYAHHPWGAHQMNGTIGERFDYLYHVFFMQKKHMKKVPAFLLASVVCVVSKAFYRGMGLISTYPDMRLTRTLEESISSLEKNVSVVIYPEDSSEGYKKKIETFFGGFVVSNHLLHAKQETAVFFRTQFGVRPAVFDGIRIGKQSFRLVQPKNGFFRHVRRHKPFDAPSGIRQIFHIGRFRAPFVPHRQRKRRRKTAPFRIFEIGFQISRQYARFVVQHP